MGDPLNTVHQFFSSSAAVCLFVCVDSRIGGGGKRFAAARRRATVAVGCAPTCNLFFASKSAVGAQHKAWQNSSQYS